MRQAGWNEIFVARHEPLVLAEVPEEPRGWRRLLWWEDLLTFGLLAVVTLVVVASIDRARWVDTMPSLYPIAMFGLLAGALLSRLSWKEGFVHVLALPIGAAAALGQVLSNLPGASPQERYWVLHHRMQDWFHAAFTGGISNDDLPFIVLVVPLTWLAAYMTSWAVFRWRNAWLALVPMGAGLLANISFQPGRFSLAFVAFLVVATLLVTRLHLLEQARAWRRERTPYPPLLSLSVLHATFWIALVLLGAAWLMPQADESGPLQSLWQRATEPVIERFESVSRLFVAVDNKKSLRVHDFDAGILAFLGSIELPDRAALDVSLSEALDEPAYLRAQSYEVYTPQGWRQADREGEFLPANQPTQADEELKQREEVEISVIAQGAVRDAVLTIGQPLSVDRPARIEWTVDRRSAAALAPWGRSRRGTYDAAGSVSVATEEDLRAAGSDYPVWVRAAYLRLPDGLPERIGVRASIVARGEETPYDRAVEIERYLRDTYGYCLNVPNTPRGRDTIDYFLFDLECGYFDYHASAMVVMLRALGIPSRLAVGYVLDEDALDRSTGRYRITEENAFAWAEVYFPRYGWVEFNPTPNRPPVARASEELAFDEAPLNVLPEGFGLGFANVDEEVRPIEEQSGGDAAVEAPAAADRTPWVIAAVVTGVVLMFAAGGGALRYAWLRGLSGLDTPARLWGQAVRLASWARLPAIEGRTPAEYARAVRERLPGAAGIEQLADGYVRHRYGKEAPSEGERSRLEAAWRSVRGALLLRLFRVG